MEATLWGTRGSVPAPATAQSIKSKIRKALELALEAGLGRDDDLDSFINEQLPFEVASTYGGNTSCVEIGHEGKRVICDMGSGIRELGKSLLASQAPLDLDIMLSHLHWDHIQGFPFFAPAYIPGARIRIWACHEGVEQVLRRQHSSPTFPVDYDVLAADISFHVLRPGVTNRINGFDVTARKQIHHGDSYGYRIEAGGKSIVFATDIEHKADQPNEYDACVDFFREADLVIFDAMFAWGETQSIRQDWGHSSNVVGVDLCRMADVKRLCLFHHDPANSDADLVESFRQTLRYAKLAGDSENLDIISGYDGLTIPV